MGNKLTKLVDEDSGEMDDEHSALYERLPTISNNKDELYEMELKISFAKKSIELNKHDYYSHLSLIMMRSQTLNVISEVFVKELMDFYELFPFNSFVWKSIMAHCLYRIELTEEKLGQIQSLFVYSFNDFLDVELAVAYYEWYVDNMFQMDKIDEIRKIADELLFKCGSDCLEGKDLWFVIIRFEESIFDGFSMRMLSEESSVSYLMNNCVKIVVDRLEKLYSNFFSSLIVKTKIEGSFNAIQNINDSLKEICESHNISDVKSFQLKTVNEYRKINEKSEKLLTRNNFLEEMMTLGEKMDNLDHLLMTISIGSNQNNYEQSLQSFTTDVLSLKSRLDDFPKTTGYSLIKLRLFFIEILLRYQTTNISYWKEYVEEFQQLRQWLTEEEFKKYQFHLEERHVRNCPFALKNNIKFLFEMEDVSFHEYSKSYQEKLSGHLFSLLIMNPSKDFQKNHLKKIYDPIEFIGRSLERLVENNINDTEENCHYLYSSYLQFLLRNESIALDDIVTKWEELNEKENEFVEDIRKANPDKSFYHFYLFGIDLYLKQLVYQKKESINEKKLKNGLKKIRKIFNQIILTKQTITPVYVWNKFIDFELSSTLIYYRSNDDCRCVRKAFERAIDNLIDVTKGEKMSNEYSTLLQRFCDWEEVNGNYETISHSYKLLNNHRNEIIENRKRKNNKKKYNRTKDNYENSSTFIKNVSKKDISSEDNITPVKENMKKSEIKSRKRKSHCVENIDDCGQEKKRNQLTILKSSVLEESQLNSISSKQDIHNDSEIKSDGTGNLIDQIMGEKNIYGQDEFPHQFITEGSESMNKMNDGKESDVKTEEQQENIINKSTEENASKEKEVDKDGDEDMMKEKEENVNNEDWQMDESKKDYLVFVSNISLKTSEKQLMNEFRKFDMIPPKIHLAKTGQGKFKGYGYIEFFSTDAVKECLKNDRKIELDGKKLIINIYEPYDSSAKKTLQFSEEKELTKIFISNLGRDCEESELKSLLNEIEGFEILRFVRYKNNIPKGFAFAVFNNPSNAEKAVKLLNEKELNKQIISAVISDPSNKQLSTKESKNKTQLFSNTLWRHGDRKMKNIFDKSSKKESSKVLEEIDDNNEKKTNDYFRKFLK
ncbi:hypothetical protein SNEBB_006685 [Seison nebaliae]|nr:hypothetical protein SNEBB_006685 [Seison nebaliae]